MPRLADTLLVQRAFISASLSLEAQRSRMQASQMTSAGFTMAESIITKGAPQSVQWTVLGRGMTMPARNATAPGAPRSPVRVQGALRYRSSMQQTESLGAFKNWFSPERASALGEALRQIHPGFDLAAYTEALSPLPELELKDRVRLISTALHAGLKLPFPEASRALVATLGSPVDPRVPNSFQMMVWPLTHYVGTYGLEHFEASMAALHAMTQRATAEFDIRPFLKRHPAATLAVLERWTADPSEHVRRLVSEGSRPRLPWGERLTAFIADPSPVLPLLERLRDDPSPYVRRSVANNLNDIAKDHPDRVVELTSRWLADAPTPERKALVRHALRSLVKAGHPGALAVLGHGGTGTLTLRGLTAPGEVRVGETLPFAFTLHNDGDTAASAVVDYRIVHAGARGARAPKVFKGLTLELAAGESRRIERRHSLRVVTTRRLYPGPHRLEVQVNGEVQAGLDFNLLPLE